MPIPISCEGCGHKMKVQDALAGRKVKCPACNYAIEVPADAAPPPEPEPSTDPFGDSGDESSGEFDLMDTITGDEQSVPCPKCDRKMKPTDVICTNCGYSKQGGDLSTANKKGFDAAALQKYGKWGGIAVAALLVVWFGVPMITGLFSGGGDDGATAPKTKPKPTTRAKAKDKPKDQDTKVADRGGSTVTVSLTPEPLPAFGSDRQAAIEALRRDRMNLLEADLEQARQRAIAAREAEQRRQAEEEAAKEAARGEQNERLREQRQAALAAAREAEIRAKLARQQAALAQVNGTIDKARKYLLSKYDGNGGFEGKFPDYIGEEALIVYALVKSGVDPNEEAISKTFDALVKYAMGQPGADKRGTYNCGLVLMALDAVKDAWVHKAEKEGDSFSKSQAHAMKTRIRVPMRNLVEGMLRNQKDGKSFSYGGRANHGGHDLSIHQYALLGLWAAYRNDIQLKRGLWEQQAKYLLELQQDDGGWAYKKDGQRMSTDTMTGAGIGSLGICYLLAEDQRVERQRIDGTEGEGDLRRDKVVDVEPKGEIEKAIERGFKWFEEHNRWQAAQPYHVYGLERACTLTQTQRIGGEDWYVTIVEKLVTSQQQDGSWWGRWSTETATAWNLLFLSRSTELLFEPVPHHQSPGESFGAPDAEPPADAPIEAQPDDADPAEQPHPAPEAVEPDPAQPSDDPQEKEQSLRERVRDLIPKGGFPNPGTPALPPQNLR